MYGMGDPAGGARNDTPRGRFELRVQAAWSPYAFYWVRDEATIDWKERLDPEKCVHDRRRRE
jgi:hypothetical protein